MALSNAERQKRYRTRLKEAASETYEIDLLRKQVAQLEAGLNTVLRKLELPEIQLPKSAYKPHR